MSSQPIGQFAEKGGGPCDAPSAWRKVQTFWADWDKESQHLSSLCAQNPIDWEAVELSLRQSNSLLATSPDARLRRISRLAKLPADTPLSTDQIVIYAMLGPSSPYVGHLGAIEAPRPPSKRWNEHMNRGKALLASF